jgi:pimeloyl-ACP methyl ester carboxylesterase
MSTTPDLPPAAPGSPVVFVHGLWVHATAWQPWMDVFAAAGYAPVNPGWPGDAPTAAASRQGPERVAGTGIAQITAHYAELIKGLPELPILVGHSFGGLLVQKLFGMGLGTACVALSPANFRGVLPLPPAQLKSAFPVLGNPFNRGKAVALTKDQYHASFASEVPREESDALWEASMILSPAKPLFEGATANVNPRTAASVNLTAQRGPLLIVGAGKDRTVPESVSRYQYGLYQKKSASVNDWHTFPDRGHSFVLDHGWHDVAEYSLEWLGKQGF